MSWERRKHQDGTYYTRSTRIRGTGRIKREYVPVAVAALVARQDEDERAEREAKREEAREAKRQQMAEYARLFAPLDVLDAACATLVRREMEAAGYHLHQHGQWRKRKQAQHGEGE